MRVEYRKCIWCTNKAKYAEIYENRFIQVCYPHHLAVNQSHKRMMDCIDEAGIYPEIDIEIDEQLATLQSNPTSPNPFLDIKGENRSE